MAQRVAFVAGDILTASDVNTYLLGEGGAWTTWVPTVTQSGTVTATVNRARYARYGRTIHFEALLTITGTGTGSNDITVTLPVAAAAASNSFAGYGQIYDGSANVSYHGPLVKTSTTVVKVASASGTVGFLGSVTFTAALANTDSVTMIGTYEAAS